MKIIIPILTLFLTSCAVHNHRYDAEQDAYYQSDYYAYDNYDPYYGYGSVEYSNAGGGVYYNNYNYYPDRWGVNYSNVYYSPYRYPRVGFYYSSSRNCSYSYWSTWCSPGYWPSYHYNSWWPSFGFSIGYSNYNYYDNYWWYNHWRNRTYDHYRPTRHGYYSARNEARRLHNGRYNSRYKNDQPRHNRSGYNNRSNPNAVSRERSNRPVNRSVNRSINRSSSRQNKPYRATKPPTRSRQEASVSNNYRNNVTSNSGSARHEVVTRSNRSGSSGLQQNIRQNHAQQSTQNNRYRYQKPAAINQQKPTRQNTRVRVKPMNSQSPVYHNNRSAVQVQQRARSNQSLNSAAQRSQPTRSQTRSQPVYNRTHQAAKPRQSSKPQSNTNRSTSRSSNRSKSDNSSHNKSQRSSNRSSARTSSRDRRR